MSLAFALFTRPIGVLSRHAPCARTSHASALLNRARTTHALRIPSWRVHSPAPRTCLLLYIRRHASLARHACLCSAGLPAGGSAALSHSLSRVRALQRTSRSLSFSSLRARRLPLSLLALCTCDSAHLRSAVLRLSRLSLALGSRTSRALYRALYSLTVPVHLLQNYIHNIAHTVMGKNVNSYAFDILWKITVKTLLLQ